MKRKLNESVAGSVKIDVVSLVHDYPELQGNIDKLAKQIEDTTGASVSQDESDDTIYMVIDGTTQDDIIDIFSEDYYIDDIDSYFAYDDNSSFDAIKDDNFSLDAIKDDNPDFDVDDAAAAQAYAEEDMMDEDMGFDDEGEWLEEWDDEEYDDSLDAMIPDYDDVEIDVVEDDDDDIYSDEYESTDDEYSDEDELNDSSFDECMEDEDFECYESERRAFKRRRAMNEKKNGCCPPKKGRMVNLSESLKMMKNGLSVKDIVRSARHISLDESIINEAINKAKNEKSKKNINEKRVTLAALKKSLGEDKFNTIVKALKEGKKTLYSKKSINGKSLNEYSSKELLYILNTVKTQHDALVKSYSSLNESSTRSTKKELRDAIENKERLMDLLDEELTYRLTVKKMLKEQETSNEDDENPLEPLSVDPTEEGSDKSETSTEDPEEDEEVELSRVVITVANQEAADELKDAMVNAGIPEDAIEFETESDEDSEDKDKDKDTDSEESKDDTEGDSEESTKEESTESNESIHYNKFKKLLEDEDADAPAEDGTEGGTDDGDAENTEDSEDSEKEGDTEATGEVKVVLTNTDYINDLADVLNNEYGITKEEFEEMIGGTIVDDESSDDEEGSDDSEDDSEDKPSTNGDDAVDAMSQEELDKLFGGN